jgi:aminopeptidase N
MRGKTMTRTAVFLFFLAALLWPQGEAVASPPHFDFNIESHRLILHIDPSKHLLKAEDRLEVQTRWGRPRTLSFLLHPHLKITRIVDQRTGQPLHWSEAGLLGQAKRWDVFLQWAEEMPLLSIFYEGTIYDPIVKEKGLQFVKGDQTLGLIGPEGVYLSKATYWYPDRPDSISKFVIDAAISEPFRIVTQGELISENPKEGLLRSKWVNELPAENLTLVAGKYSVKTRTVEGVKISTYFFHEEDRFSEAFLNAAEEYLKIYSELLGAYPFKKFDIVQNFFSSGYGFPTFTLLAPEAIRQGKKFLRPGALDHEIVHSWWGHYVSLKSGTGNWAEALTTYCANYYYKELKMGKEAARKYRQQVMQKYAVQVAPSKDYSLRKFEGKETEVDGQIGYGKGSMVFHMLRRMVGKDLFFSILRQFAGQYGGKQASWEEIQRIFEETSGQELDDFFSQWLDRPGGPQIKLENVRVQTASTGHVVSGEVVQEGEVYQLLLPIEVDEGLEQRRLFLEVSKRRSPFSMEVSRVPLTLTLDPDDHLFRRLYPEEIPPALNALLEDREKIFIVSDQEDEESRKIYLELAGMAKEQKGGEILAIREVTEEKLRNSSVMLLGESWKGPIFSKFLSKIPKPVGYKEGSFFVKGDRVGEGEESLVLTFPNPLHPGKWVTVYFGRSVNALSRSRYLFFYGWDSYILFRNGRPKERGNLSPRTSFVSYDFISKDEFAKIERPKLKEHLSSLASPDPTGRLPGAPGNEKSQAYLIKELEGMGMTPVVQPFSVAIKDIKESTLILKTPHKEEKLKAIPFRFCKRGKWEGPFTWVDPTVVEEVDKLSGQGSIFFLGLTNDFRSEQLLRRVMELQGKGARAILFFIQEEGLDHFAPYLTYPSYFPPKLEEKLLKRERSGAPVQRLIEASKVATKAKEPDFSIHIPVLFVPYSRLEEERVKTIIGQKDALFEINVGFKETIVRDVNIVGMIEGRDPDKKKEFLLLGARYDHPGKGERSGMIYTGADDPAPGVSALLEIGRSLMKRKADLKRSVLLLFLGGQEWGWQGSRDFLNQAFIPLRQMKAMFCLDLRGGTTGEKEAFLVGSSIRPSLAQISRKFLEPLGIKEGRNIDASSFEPGKIRHPFREKGVPTVDFLASDPRRMAASRDRAESVDFEKLGDLTRLIYLSAYEFLTEP